MTRKFRRKFKLLVLRSFSVGGLLLSPLSFLLSPFWYQVSSIRKTKGGICIKFGGSEAFALSEGLTYVKTQKNFAGNLNSFLLFGIRYQVSGIRKTKGGICIKFGGSEAFALSEGLTNVKTQKNFAGNLNSFLLFGIRYQVSRIRKTKVGFAFGGSDAFALSEVLTSIKFQKFRKKFKLLSPLSFLLFLAVKLSIIQVSFTQMFQDLQRSFYVFSHPLG